MTQRLRKEISDFSTIYTQANLHNIPFILIPRLNHKAKIFKSLVRRNWRQLYDPEIRQWSDSLKQNKANKERVYLLEDDNDLCWKCTERIDIFVQKELDDLRAVWRNGAGSALKKRRLLRSKSQSNGALVVLLICK